MLEHSESLASNLFVRVLFLSVILASVPSVLFCNQAAAQVISDKKQAIDQLLASYIQDHHIPALSVAVVSDGKLLVSNGYGLADVENNVPATAETVYRIASLSKPVTATAAMELVQTGKLDLDAPIQKYCPAFPQKHWTITTRELLSHQSGIRDYKNDEETVNTRHYASINNALPQFANDPLQFEPATKMRYSSYGYVVLGCVVEGAAGEEYDDYMRQAIFTPAGMKTARLDDVFAIIPHRARGYRLTTNGQLQNAQFVDISNKPPGSGINASADDMGNFVAALYSGKLVSRTTLNRMLTPAKTKTGKNTIYGLGFFVGGPIGNYRGLKEAGHGGDQQGFSSVLYLLPEKQFGVVVLSNMEGQDNSTNFIGLARKIYDILMPESAAPGR